MAATLLTSGNASTSTGTTSTLSLTATTTDKTIFFASLRSNSGAANINSATLGGLPCKIIKGNDTVGNGGASSYFIACKYPPTNPTLSISNSASENWIVNWAMVDGADLNTTPSVSNYITGSTTQPETPSIVSTANGSFGLVFTASADAATLNSGATQRQNSGGSLLADSNGSVNSGSSFSPSVSVGTRTHSIYTILVAPYKTGTVEALIVAGGGGGSYAGSGGGGGGGGAGGVQLIEGAVLTAGTYTVTVGAGGAGSVSSGAASSGSDSSFNGTTSTGGGKGESGFGVAGTSGGSGGGTAYQAGAGGSGTTGQGFAGGQGAATGSPFGGGGGGGASAAGGPGVNSSKAGSGGNGLPFGITGSSVTYGGGGGGGKRTGGTAGTGGTGGGGNGATTTGGNGSNGTANTGGGGGGSSDSGTGGNGGSGVVVLRILTADWTSITGGTQTTSGGFTICTFNSSGSLVLANGSSYTSTLTDTITLVETTAKNIGKVLSESFTFVETFFKYTVLRVLSDTYSLVETFAKSFTRTLTENVIPLDSRFGLNYDGQVNTYVQLGSINPSSFSFEAWFQTNTPTTSQSLFARSTGVSDLIDINGTTPGTIRLNLVTSGGTININTTGIFSMDTGVHHALITFDASTGIGSIYVDGILRVQSSSIGAVTLTNNGALTWRLGALATNTRNLNGVLYGARLWSSVLSATDVNQLYSQSNVIPQSVNLIGNWQPTAGSGSTVADTSGAGNNGTINGGVTWKQLLFTKQPQKNVSDGIILADDNLVPNGNFENIPPFTAAKTGSGAVKSIDGTINGGVLPNGITYKWVNGGSGGISVQYDQSIFNSGIASLKMSTTAISSYTETFLIGMGGAMQASNYYTNAIPIIPGKTYAWSFYMKTNFVSGDSSNGATCLFIRSDGANNFVALTVPSYVKTTTAWTKYSGTFTAGANEKFLQINPRVYGHTGTATLIMDAWFDDITVTAVGSETTDFFSIQTLKKVTESAISITDSFVKNFIKTFTETYTLAESFVKQTGKALKVAVILQDIRKNLCINPNFETGILNWSTYVNGGAGVQPTATRDTTEFYAGSASLKIVTNGASYAYSGMAFQITTAVIGQMYTVSGYVKGTAGNNINIYPSNNTIGTFSYTQTGSWMRISCTFIATQTNPTIYFRTSSAPGTVFYLDNVQLEVGSTATTYFDGDITPAYWSGTARASVSQIDMRLASINKYYNDTIVLLDSATRLFIRTLTDTLSLVDSMLHQIGKNFVEIITLSDSFVRSFLRTVTDTVSLVDTMTRMVIHNAFFSETINLTDDIVRRAIKMFSDTLSLVESFVKGKIPSIGKYVLKSYLPLRNTVVAAYTPISVILKDVKNKITKLKL